MQMTYGCKLSSFSSAESLLRFDKWHSSEPVATLSLLMAEECLPFLRILSCIH